MMGFFIKLVSCMLSLGAAYGSCHSDPQYQVTFYMRWTRALFSVDYPTNPRVGPLAAGVHSSRYSAFAIHGYATKGLKRLAEAGKTKKFVDDLRKSVYGGQVVSNYGTGKPDNAHSVILMMNGTFGMTQVSAAARLAPGPGWFTGVSNLELCVNGTWVPYRRACLFAMHSGTKTALGPLKKKKYMNIVRIKGPPFNDAPVGYYIVRKVKI